MIKLNRSVPRGRPFLRLGGFWIFEAEESAGFAGWDANPASNADRLDLTAFDCFVKPISGAIRRLS